MQWTLLETNLLKLLLTARREGKVELFKNSSVASRLLEMGQLQYLEDAQNDTAYYILTDSGKETLDPLDFSKSGFHTEALKIDNSLLPHEQRQSIHSQIASAKTEMNKFRTGAKTPQDWLAFRQLRSLVKKQEMEQILWEIYIADQPEPLVYQVAEAFHFAVCPYNHTDGCFWYYDNWGSEKRQIYLQLINELAKTDNLEQWLVFMKSRKLVVNSSDFGDMPRKFNDLRLELKHKYGEG